MNVLNHISVTGLSKRFNKEWIFRNFSHEFQPGNTYVILGRNGSGKSTLLQILSGYIPQSSGDLKYLTSAGCEIQVEKIYQRIAIAAPYLDLIEEFTLQELLHFHFKLKPIRSGFSPDDMLKILYLETAKNKFLGNFSSGMKQRVKLGLALYTDADFYFIDEPGTNLDEYAFNWYLEEVKKLPKHATVIMASNNPAEFPQKAQFIKIEDYKK